MEKKFTQFPISFSLSRNEVTAVIACASYSVCSMLMTLTNKAVLTTYQFPYPLSTLLYQNIFTIIFLLAARRAKLLDFPPMRKDIVMKWIPVNILFIMMLISGSYALKFLAVPMVTIFKNLATTGTSLGDSFFFGQRLSIPIMISIFLMVMSSVVAGYNDLLFDVTGYTWMMGNCLVSAAYVLYIRGVMKTTRLTEWEMVFYNNVLSIPTLLPLLFISGEFPAIFSDFSLFTGSFLWVFLWSGVSGFLLSSTSFWAVKTTSPTTYSIVGSLNKIPLTILGFFLFESPVTLLGRWSIAIGLWAGLLYSLGKHRLKKQTPLLPVQKMDK